MKTHVLAYENPRFLIVKRRFMIGKTRFYYLYSIFASGCDFD